MTTEEARRIATEAINLAQEMNASYEHIPSKNKASLAGIVIDLCAQLDAAREEIAAHKADVAASGEIAKAKASRTRAGANLGAVGGE
jgi:HD superfamily phosphohydrolase YqeK